MLTGVPEEINRVSRQMVLYHPNSIECTVYKKTVNREVTEDPTELGGHPTVGGMGVLDSEDEADYEYETELGEAKVVFTGIFNPTQGGISDDGDVNLYPEGLVEALVECIVDPEMEGYFTPEKHNMLMLHPGGGVVLPYEIVGVTGNVNIPPYTRKYILNPRSDLDVGI